MDTTRRDLLVGLFILITGGVLLGAFIVTSGIFEPRVDLYLRAENARGLSQDTRVYLSGLQIGRVADVNPVVTEGGLSFVARLSIRTTYTDGTELVLPIATVGQIEQETPLSPPVIRLQLPEIMLGRAPLLPGDTIQSVRTQNALDLISQLTTELKDEVLLVLADARTLMAESKTAVQRGDEAIRSITPVIQATAQNLQRSFSLADQLMTDLTPRVGILHDSLLVTLAQTRDVLTRFQTLASTGERLLLDNQAPLQSTIQHLEQAARTLNHFADQISRRPMRLVTGVTPPDSTNRIP